MPVQGTTRGERGNRDDGIAPGGVDGLPLLDLDAFDPAAAATDAIDQAEARKHGILPLVRRGRTLFVATASAPPRGLAGSLRDRTGLAPRFVLVDGGKLASANEAWYAGTPRPRQRAPRVASPGEAPDVAGPGQPEPARALGRPASNGIEAAADETPVVRFVEGTLHEAIRAGASDIHIEPYRDWCRIRFRVDGVLREASRPPPALAPRLASRLKVMAQLDIAERRLPQDGRIRLALGGDRAIDMRVNTMPTMWGEKIVLRLLDAASTRVGVERLGFEPEQKRLFLDALARPQGMILVTGPTGSGKSVTLYSGLAEIDTEERNVATAEDPVEINVDGINQVQVNPKVGLDFATALRAFLRQDPDVVMVGEIRDLETAETAVRAAQTGHLLLATLHTNSAAETLVRLRNMGVAAFNLATSVSLIVAQRLARVLCERCKHPLALRPPR